MKRRSKGRGWSAFSAIQRKPARVAYLISPTTPAEKRVEAYAKAFSEVKK